VSVLSHRPLVEVAEDVTVGYVGPSSKYFCEDGVLFLRTGNVGQRKIILSNLKRVLPAFHAKQKKSSLKAGDVVVSRVISDEIYAAVVPPNLDGANCGNIIVIRPGSLLDARYLAHLISYPPSQRKLLGRQVGSAQAVVNTGVLKSWEVPLLPIHEQRRIAEVLDRAEVLRANRRASLAQLDTLTQSIFLDLFGDPAQNTKGLRTVSIGELGEWQSGGTPPRGREDYFRGSVPWFSSGELNEMVVSESEERISTLAVGETSAKAVPTGALMLGMYDTAALKASIAGVPCSCNQAIAFARINGQMAETVFVYFAIVIGREHFKRMQRGIRQKNLNLSMIRELRIPLPDLSIQRKFAEHVASTEKLKISQLVSLAELDALFAVLQHRAFRGEL
jgi:type I restriction enzyme, S subunit